jgi:hypothetical protein
MYGSKLTPAKLIIVIRTGDRMICDYAISFLRDQLPLWKGMWHQSALEIPSSNDSVTDHFVKVSRCINILEERSVMDRTRILFHRVLQYQYYLRTLDRVEQNALKMERKQCVRNATYALNHLLRHLYIYDWDRIGPAEKQSRSGLLHKQKRFGKRLQTLISCMGLGILLLSSSEAMGRMKVASQSNQCR